MPDSPGSSASLDGAITAFLLRVVQQFESLVTDPDRLLATLRGVGLDSPGVDQLQAFLTARAADVKKISDDLPELMSILESSNPDYTALIAPVTDLWKVIAGLVDAAPKVSPDHLALAPTLPNGDVIGQLVTIAIDRAIRQASTALWASLAATGFVGPGASILSAVSDAVAHPLQYVWQLYQRLRRENTLSIAGVLTGPRAISMTSVELAATEAPSDAAKTAFGANVVVVQRLVLKIAADTYGTPVVVSIDLLATSGLPPTFVAAVLSIADTTTPINLGSVLTLQATPAKQDFALALKNGGDIVILDEPDPTLSLSANSARTFTVGSDGGIQVSLQQPVVEVDASPTTWHARFGLTGFSLTIPQNAGGPLLALFLPERGVSLTGKLLFRFDESGLHFDGGVGLSMTWPDVVHLPGVVLHSLKTDLTISGAQFPIAAAGTVVVSLGPLTITIEGFGVSLPLALTTNGSGNLGILDLQPPSFTMPTGIGVAIDASVVVGGGFLRVADHQISGALELALVLGSLELSIQAFGIIEEVNGELSFIVIMSVEFSPPIEIFLGLTLNAVGGVFGLNRTIDTPSLQGLVHDGRTNDVLIPKDLIAHAPEILATVAVLFPAKSGQYIVGPVLELGWGRPISLVRMTAGVLFTFPDPVVVAIIGELTIDLPDPDAPIIHLQADFAGTINLSTGDVSFDASLSKSRIGMFDVGGDLALRAGAQSFVFTAGGFHPKFTPPPDLQSIRRLSISLSPSPLLHIWAEAYFAITASTVQFGGGLYLEAKLGPIGAKGHLSLDALIQTEPKLHFVVTISGEFQLTVGGDDIATISVDVLLEGPGRWHAHAHASIDILFFSISGTLDLAWGTESLPPLGPPVDVIGRVHDAFTKDAVWTHVLPAADGGTVQLRSGAYALHPLGLLRLTQTEAPLGVALAKFGANAVVSPDPVSVQISSTAGVAVAAQEEFAVAQFFDLSDEDRLTKPAFLPFDAGSLLQGSAWQVDDAVPGVVVYEESLGDDSTGFAHSFRVLDEVSFGWATLGAAGRVHAAQQVTRVLPAKIGVSPITYSVADAATGAIVSSAAESVVAASPWRSADLVAVADFELSSVR